MYMYTVYTYLSVDIYECTSNVSITCSIVIMFFNIMLYLYMGPSAIVTVLTTKLHVHYYTDMHVKCCIIVIF